MTKRRQALGAWGERHAVRHLESAGCQIVATNWRCSAGEVDIVALDGECLAFVEVRTRRGQAYGTPEESITPNKLARMIAVAETYVHEEAWEGDWRLDVVAIQVEGRRVQSVEWYRNVSM
jgi:putative endonuclease